MTRVQTAALALFARRGFDAVSIEQIAAAADVGPATIYRNFGTKERIVLWDDYDPMLLAGVARELAAHDVLTAVRRGLVASLAEVYRRDRARILQRVRLVRATPALRRANDEDLRGLRAALAGLFVEARRAADRMEADVLAGAIVAALEAGVEHWADQGGRLALSRALVMAFGRLRSLGAAVRHAHT